MTIEEATASVNFINHFEVLQWIVGLASGIVISLSGALVFMYRDNRAERKEWRTDLSTQNDRLNQTLEKVVEALRGVEISNKNVETSNENLANVVARQEQTTRNLELLITQKLNK